MSLDEIDDETLKDFKLKEIAFDEITGGEGSHHFLKLYHKRINFWVHSYVAQGHGLDS